MIGGSDRIAGWKTCEDWQELRVDLTKADSSVASWAVAYDRFFRTRLQLRYLDPIAVLQENGTFRGEGFSIAAIQCSLVEFLESTWEGTKYRYLARGQTIGSHEYSSSANVFVSFLTKRRPFSQQFDRGLAQSFYEGVRCALLHEARTRHGWKIAAQDHSDRIVDPTTKTMFRNGFQSGLLTFIDDYRQVLLDDRERQTAFIRKFDDLCT